MLLLEAWDPRGEGHRCTVDALGRIYDKVKDHPTAVEHRWEEVVRRVQARLPYVTVGAFVALPPVSAQLATWRNPQSPPARSPVMRHARDLVRRWVQDLMTGEVLR